MGDVYNSQSFKKRCINEIAKKHWLDEEEVAKAFQAMIDSVSRAIKETDYDEFENVNVPYIPYIGKMNTTKRKHARFVNKVNNIKKRKNESS